MLFLEQKLQKAKQKSKKRREKERKDSKREEREIDPVKNPEENNFCIKANYVSFGTKIKKILKKFLEKIFT